MQRIKLYQLFFKCCHKIDNNNKGYQYNGKYIECISQHCWALFLVWSKDKSTENRHNLISIFADIKIRQSKNWRLFMHNPKMPVVPFKKEFQLVLSEIEPTNKCIAYNFNNEIIYETYIKHQK